jgi:formylglycine-generating enzyme required for sulfatase activity
MSDIFLSYASGDRERVRPLVEALEQAGWSVFWDFTIPAGMTWRRFLQEKLENTRSIVVVWSEHSINSRWVLEEADEAESQKIPIIPVLLDNVSPPLGFRSIQAKNLSGWDGDPSSPLVRDLFKDITNILGPPAAAEAIEPVPTKPIPLEPKVTEAKKGRLWVNTDSDDARVAFLNLREEFSQGMELEPGRYELQVTAEGFETKMEAVELDPGEEKHTSLKLTKLQAHLWVETEPTGATVRMLNLETEFVQGMALEPGRYEVEVSKEGYEAKREGVELGAGEDRHIIVGLSPVITPHLTEPAPPEPEVTESEPIEPKPAEPLKPKTPEEMRRNRAMLIGVPAVLALLFLIVGLWWFLSGGSPVKPVALERQPVKPPPVEKPPEKSPAQVKRTPETTAPRTITNSLGMKLVLIRAGTFQMGSPPNEIGHQQDLQHQVTISQPFYLQTTEVTQGQWQQVMGKNPSHFKNCGEDCPVEMVSWEEAQEFIKKLNRMEETDKYRLPTESEWEYACRAGSTSHWSFGDDESKLGTYAWYYDNSGLQTHPVGKKKPNAWGLYDMHGNVSEWCQDLIRGPLGPNTKKYEKYRLVRGGSWKAVAFGLYSAYGLSRDPDDRDYTLGFRVARDL